MIPEVAQPEPQFPDYYQREDVNWVFNAVRAGESCSLLGIGSVGKSNLMQLLTTDPVKVRCLQQQASTTLMILIDPHKLIYLDQRALEQGGASWPGYEILLSRLRRALTELEDKGRLPPKPPNEDDLIQQVEAHYLNLFDDQPILAQAGIRHLEESVYEVLRSGPGWRIAFLFDEIESFLHLPPEFFQSLRGLRDEFKQRVMFITSSRFPLDDLVQKRVKPEGHEMMESFTELFHGFTHYIGLLDRPSAEFAVRRLERRYAQSLRPNEEQTLMNITGCHAGLLRRSFRPFANLAGTNISIEQLFDHLLKDRGITQECEVMFNSLSPAEQDYLRDLAAGKKPSMKEDAWKSLNNKHLVTVGNNGEPTFTMPVMGGFLMKEKARNSGS